VVLGVNEFSKRFKYLRESRKLTQDQVADTLGISRSTVAGYESEEKSRVPRKDTLNKIADLFGVSTDYLLGRDNGDNSILHPAQTELIQVIKGMRDMGTVQNLIDIAKKTEK
jgi:transcriptional regulator with XRE-family HTH domain